MRRCGAGDAINVDAPAVSTRQVPKRQYSPQVRPSGTSMPSVSGVWPSYRAGNLMLDQKVKLLDGSIERARDGPKKIHVLTPKKAPSRKRDSLKPTSLLGGRERRLLITKRSTVFRAGRISRRLHSRGAILPYPPIGTSKVRLPCIQKEWYADVACSDRCRRSAKLENIATRRLGRLTSTRSSWRKSHARRSSYGSRSAISPSVFHNMAPRFASESTIPRRQKSKSRRPSSALSKEVDTDAS